MGLHKYSASLGMRGRGPVPVQGSLLTASNFPFGGECALSDGGNIVGAAAAASAAAALGCKRNRERGRPAPIIQLGKLLVTDPAIPPSSHGPAVHSSRGSRKYNAPTSTKR